MLDNSEISSTTSADDNFKFRDAHEKLDTKVDGRWSSVSCSCGWTQIVNGCSEARSEFSKHRRQFPSSVSRPTAKVVKPRVPKTWDFTELEKLDSTYKNQLIIDLMCLYCAEIDVVRELEKYFKNRYPNIFKKLSKTLLNNLKEILLASQDRKTREKAEKTRISPPEF